MSLVCTVGHSPRDCSPWLVWEMQSWPPSLPQSSKVTVGSLPGAEREQTTKASETMLNHRPAGHAAIELQSRPHYLVLVMFLRESYLKQAIISPSCSHKETEAQTEEMISWKSDLNPEMLDSKSITARNRPQASC